MLHGNTGMGAAFGGQPQRHGSRSDHPSPPADPEQRSTERGKHRFHNIRLHRQFAPVLIAITLLCTLGLTGLAYVGARSYAISGAEAQALQDIQVERQLLLPHGAALQLQNGRLVISSSGAPLVLNNDSTLVDQTRSLVGSLATIYQAEGSRLVAISTNLPTADSHGAPASGTRALGDVLTGPAFDALQGSCAAASPPSCHEPYQGIITVRGIAYVAALTPLYDANGMYVGALSVARPLDTVTAPAVQLAVLLLIAGLLLTLVSVVAGFWFFGLLANRTLGKLDLRLHSVAVATSELERLAQLQATRAGRQELVARQVSEQIRSLDAMAEVMEHGHASLRDASGDVWAEMSQPGAHPNPATAIQLAQRAAVSAAQVGSAAEDARGLCRQLVGLMNHVIAEGAIVGDDALEMESRAKDLRIAMEGVETTVGERLLQRSPILRRVRAVSERVRRFLPAPFSTEPPAPASAAPPPPAIQSHTMAQWKRSAASGHIPNPRGPRPQQRPQQQRHPEQPSPFPQQKAPRTPPHLINTGQIPPVLPGERPGYGHLGSRGPAAPNPPGGAAPPQSPPPDDWPPGNSRHSGHLG